MIEDKLEKILAGIESVIDEFKYARYVQNELMRYYDGLEELEYVTSRLKETEQDRENFMNEFAVDPITATHTYRKYITEYLCLNT